MEKRFSAGKARWMKRSNAPTSLSQSTQPGGQTLSLAKYGSQGQSDMVMIAEFGNYAKTYPGFPEVPTIGWVYANLKIRFVDK